MFVLFCLLFMVTFAFGTWLGFSRIRSVFSYYQSPVPAEPSAAEALNTLAYELQMAAGVDASRARDSVSPGALRLKAALTALIPVSAGVSLAKQREQQEAAKVGALCVLMLLLTLVLVLVSKCPQCCWPFALAHGVSLSGLTGIIFGLATGVGYSVVRLAWPAPPAA